MQSDKDEESNGRNSGKGDDGLIDKNKTIEYHLKTAHTLHCDEIRALKIQVRDLKRKLEEESSRKLQCIQCDSMKNLLNEQEVAFEEKLHEKNKIICELRHKLELSELQTSNRASGSPNQCATKKRRISGKDSIKWKKNLVLNPSSDDDVKILTIKSDCTTSFSKSAELPKFDPTKECARNHVKEVNHILVPDTLVEDMEIRPLRAGNSKDTVLIVPETLHIELDFRETESPIFNNLPSRTMKNCYTIDEKNAPRSSPIKAMENLKSARMIKENPGSNAVGDVEKQREAHGKRKSDLTPVKKFDELLSDDLDMSMDEFQIQPIRKGKLSKSACSFDPTNGNNCLNITTATRKVRTPSPRPKYKLHFSPARPGHKKPKYKQTTLTQKTFGSWQDSEIGREKSDYDLNKAIEESLRVHEGHSHELRKSQMITRHQSKTSTEERSNDDDTDDLLHALDDSCLDATFVSSQVLRRTCMDKRSTALSKARQSNETVETKGNFVDDTPGSEDLIQQMLSEFSPKKESKSKNSAPQNQIASKSDIVQDYDNCIDDFDIVPNNKISSQNYKYQGPTVRKQNERRKLDGFECRECAAYVAAMGLDDEEKKKRLKECSRHRGKYALPTTPEHFWSIDFPSTQECKDRGIMNTTQYKPLRRRRPLK